METIHRASLQACVNGLQFHLRSGIGLAAGAVRDILALGAAPPYPIKPSPPRCSRIDKYRKHEENKESVQPVRFYKAGSFG